MEQDAGYVHIPDGFSGNDFNFTLPNGAQILIEQSSLFFSNIKEIATIKDGRVYGAYLDGEPLVYDNLDRAFYWSDISRAEAYGPSPSVFIRCPGMPTVDLRTFATIQNNFSTAAIQQLGHTGIDPMLATACARNYKLVVKGFAISWLPSPATPLEKRLLTVTATDKKQIVWVGYDATSKRTGKEQLLERFWQHKKPKRNPAMVRDTRGIRYGRYGQYRIDD